MEFSTVGGGGSFHCFHQLHLTRIKCLEASMSFHIPLHTSIYFHEYHKTYGRFHKPNPNPNPNPKLELPRRKLAYF